MSAKPRIIGGLASVSLVLLALAACGDGESGISNAGTLDCQAIPEDEVYRYKATVTYALEQRPDGAPPENPDLGSDAFEFKQEIKGAVQGLDRAEALIEYPGTASFPVPVIVVGGVQWNQVNNKWVKHDGALQELFSPTRLCNALAPDIGLEGVSSQEDDVNGISALHYRFESLPTQFPFLLWEARSDFVRILDEFNVDIWVAKKSGFPVRINVEGIGRYENERELVAVVWSEIEKLNDKSIKIQPPE